jgi:hypothetical protein
MIAMHTFGAGPYTSAMSSMLRALIAARGWILGIQILVLISCLNGFVQTGDAFSALTCLAAVGLFSLFAGLISSAVYGLAASLCFAMVLLAPLHHYMRLTAQTVLAMTAFLASAMALVLLVHRLRKLGTVPKDKKDDDALRDIRAHFVEEMRLTTFDELSASIAHEIAQPLSAIVLDGSGLPSVGTPGQSSRRRDPGLRQTNDKRWAPRVGHGQTDPRPLPVLPAAPRTDNDERYRSRSRSTDHARGGRIWRDARTPALLSNCRCDGRPFQASTGATKPHAERAAGNERDRGQTSTTCHFLFHHGGRRGRRLGDRQRTRHRRLRSESDLRAFHYNPRRSVRTGTLDLQVHHRSARRTNLSDEQSGSWSKLRRQPSTRMSGWYRRYKSALIHRIGCTERICALPFKWYPSLVRIHS